MHTTLLLLLAILELVVMTISGVTALYEMVTRLRGVKSPVPMWLTLGVLGICTWWLIFVVTHGGLGYFGTLYFSQM